MKKSLILFINLLFIIILTDRITYFLIQKMDNQVFSGLTVGKINHFMRVKDNVNLLVFGSSRGNHHVNTMLLDSSSFNVSIDGKKTAYFWTLTGCLEKKGQTILVHIDPKNMYDPQYKGREVLTLSNLFHRNTEIKTKIKQLFPAEAFMYQIFYSAVYRNKFIGILKNYIRPKYDIHSYSGFDPLYPSPQQAAAFKKLMAYEDRDESYPVFSDTVNSLVDKAISGIESICKKNNDRLVFFTSPTLRYKNYRLREKTEQWFKMKRITYWDFSESIGADNLQLWKDEVHLSSKGAVIFTRQLKEMLNSGIIPVEVNKR